MRPPSRFREKDLTEHTTPISTLTRPTSEQGLSSASTKGGERQIADKTMYIGLIRSKMNEVTKEVERLSADLDAKKRGQGLQISLQETLSALTDDLTKAEAELADYNVLKDRVQNKVAIEDLTQSYQDLIDSNKRLETEVNKLYRENKKLNQSVSDQEAAAFLLFRGEGNPQVQDLNREIESLERELANLRGNSGDLKGKSKDELLQIVKEITASISQNDKKIQEEQKALQYVKNQNKSLDEKEQELQTEKGKKYLTLLEREKSMNTYLQNYPQNLETVKNDIAEHQQNIQNILLQTSQEINVMASIPSKDAFKNIQEDMSFKARDKDDAQTTADKLRITVEQRKQELISLKDVDKAIEKELETIEQQMIDMKKKMPEFEDVDTVRQEGEIRKKQKEEERDGLRNQSTNMKRWANLLASQYNESRAALRANPVHTKIHDFEKEIGSKAKDNFQIIEFLEENRRKSNYQNVRREVMEITENLNKNL